MSQRYFIENGQTISPVMNFDWDGAVVSFLFFDAGGLPVVPVGTPLVSRSMYDTGNIFDAVGPFTKSEWRFNGPAARVKVDLAGVSGFATYRVIIWRTDDPLPLDPDGAYAGLRAITVQPYTEANVKNGTQFYMRAAWPTADPIAAGTTRKILFQTGAKKVVIKLRDLFYISEEATINLYQAPVVTAGTGTVIPVRNYNRVNPVATTVTARVNVTTTSDGTLFDGPEYVFGSSNAPQRSPNSIPSGRERILPANTAFLVTITAAAGIGTSRLQYFLDWYEGDTDLPL